MIIIGISAFYHDSAVALFKNGDLLSAVQEERFSRIKHDQRFPQNSIKYCLAQEKLNINDVDYFCFYEKPFLKFERLIDTYLSFAPYGFQSFKLALPIWIKEKLFQKKILLKELIKMGANKNVEKKLLFSEHHLSHAASAFYSSPFKRAAFLTLDGVGEWATSTFGVGRQRDLRVLKEIHFPHSLGLFYSAFTYYTGFKVNSGEYKLMGLAPYGEPKYIKVIKDNLIDVKDDGSFRLNLKYFNYPTGLSMINDNFNKIFKNLPRKPDQKIDKFYCDIAASIQLVLEEVVVKIAKSIKKETGEENLCLAGGVALNCVANSKIIKNKIFKNVWIQPAAGDAGGAIGAALITWNAKGNPKYNSKENYDKMNGCLLGPKYSKKEIGFLLNNLGLKYHEFDREKLIKTTVDLIIQEKVVGWFQGKMEFGPRALGNRSILADPRSSNIQYILNKKIKNRESFRPFAPSVLKEYASKWFDLENESPYMLITANVLESRLCKIIQSQSNLSIYEKLKIKRSIIPAVTHVDNSSRVQTVSRDVNSLYYDLIKLFYKKTQVPMLLNTSFNVRGEPIVCCPEDALKCFLKTKMDLLVIENFLIYKNEQDATLIKNLERKYQN